MNIKGWYTILLFMCIAYCTLGQSTSRLGRFKVDQTKGCAPFTVTITIIDPWMCDADNPCDMFFGETSGAQNLTFTHTYTQPGTFLLRVLFQTKGFDDISIQVFPNTPPAFDLYTCGGNQVSVNITDTNYNQYVINYNDGTPEVVKPVGSLAKDQHAYGSSAIQTVTVKGRNVGALDNCNPASKNITTMASLPTPVITQLRVIDNTSIQLDFTGLPNILYRLEIATNTANTFQLVKTSYNVTSETISNLKPEDNYYCFRLGVFDPCNNRTEYSNTICSSNFDLSVQNNSNNLSWSTSVSGVSNFRLTRTSDGASFTTTVTSSPYADTDIVCGTEYCYQLTANYPNGSNSISLQKCGTAISTDRPAPVENITAIVGQPGVNLRWQTTSSITSVEFSVFKTNGNTNELLTKTALPQATDDAYVTESGACYKISYKDVCGNESSLSAEACPIQLSGNLLKDNSINLNWTTYSGWRNGVQDYVIEKYSEQGQLLQTFTPGTGVNFVDNSQDLANQIYIYVVRANAADFNLPQAVSNRITIIKDPNLFYPTAFTPNGDNLNDIFNVYGQYIDSFEMNIFNRWGELMYTTTQLDEGWDGNFRGNPMPEGTYAFVANITDSAGRNFNKSGSVVLLRKNK